MSLAAAQRSADADDFSAPQPRAQPSAELDGFFSGIGNFLKICTHQPITIRQISLTKLGRVTMASRPGDSAHVIPTILHEAKQHK